MKMLPNMLSMLRMPLALFFLQTNVTIRCVALILAMLTDFFDGYLARKFKCTSAAGRFLDPLADKCFVISVLTIFLMEDRLTTGEALLMLSREFSVFLFGVYLLFTGNLFEWHSRSIWSGKVATTMQLLILYALTCNEVVPYFVYLLFIPLGLAGFIELFIDRHRLKIED